MKKTFLILLLFVGISLENYSQIPITSNKPSDRIDAFDYGFKKPEGLKDSISLNYRRWDTMDLPTFELTPQLYWNNNYKNRGIVSVMTKNNIPCLTPNGNYYVQIVPLDSLVQYSLLIVDLK